jgi:NCS1 family nucleobase:cation symporter-1
LFRLRGRYTYANGINPRAIIALVLAIAPVVPGFIRAVSVPGGSVAHPTFFDRLYSYAWFVTFGLSLIIYWMLMRRETIAPKTKP